jgi:hypothetical protein
MIVPSFDNLKDYIPDRYECQSPDRGISGISTVIQFRMKYWLLARTTTPTVQDGLCNMFEPAMAPHPGLERREPMSVPQKLVQSKVGISGFISSLIAG